MFVVWTKQCLHTIRNTYAYNDLNLNLSCRVGAQHAAQVSPYIPRADIQAGANTNLLSHTPPNFQPLVRNRDPQILRSPLSPMSIFKERLYDVD